MRDFNAGRRRTLFDNGVEKISPKQLEIVAIRLLQLGILMNGLIPSIGGIECPTVPPTDVQCALGAVKISADLVSFCIVACEAAMFPYAGEFLELECRDLMVRRVGGLFLLIDDDRTSHRSAARAEHALRVLFLRPPEHLVEPMDAPVAECSVRVVEEIAPATWMELGVERTKRRGSAPQIPIHAVGRFSVGRRNFPASGAVSEKAHHSHFADRAGLEEFHAADMVRTDAPMKSHLHNFAARSRGTQHCAALVDGVAGGFLQ